MAAALAREQERGAEAARRKRISAGEVCGAGIGCDCEPSGPDFDGDGCGTAARPRQAMALQMWITIFALTFATAITFGVASVMLHDRPAIAAPKR